MMKGASQEKFRWPRAEAQAVADEILTRLGPHCEKVVVAGSLRRQRPTVGDVEILYISSMEERPLDMFSSQACCLAEEEITRMLSDGTLRKRPTATGGTVWGDLNKLAVHRTGIPVDLFRTTQAAWYNYLVCRTGPASSNLRIATLAQQKGWKWNPYGPGYTHRSEGTARAMDSEAAVFEFVGLPCLPPEERE